MTKFIAEVSSNHNGDLQRALEFIKVSADCGFTAVKFQLFKVEKLFTQEVLNKSPNHRKRVEWELPEEFIPSLANFAHELGLEFSCTPFYLEAISILSPYCDFLKIASYELLWHELANTCAETGLPLIVSTGMANLDEIDSAVNNLKSNFPRIDLTLLHAVSSYPAPVEECNLSAIQKMAARYRLPVGWSDHTVSNGIINRAVHKFGATAVEMHIDLDGKGFEYDSGHCWLPRESKALISSVREGLASDGDGEKRPVPAEIPDRAWRADPSDGLRPLLQLRNRK
jgi:N-acetylneuraminate synthase